MKYIAGAIGALLLIYLLSLEQVSAFGNVCYIIGSAKSGELWGSDVNQPLCLNPAVYYAGLVAAGALLVVSLLFVAKDIFATETDHGSLLQSYNLHQQSNRPQSSAPVQVRESEVGSANTPAWKTLKEFDADIQDAVREVSAYGSAAEERLATAYLAVNDKGLLTAIVSKIVRDEQEAGTAREEARLAREEKAAKMEKEVSEQDREAVERRRPEALATIEEIKNNGMMFNGKRVLSAEMYVGDSEKDLGWAIVTYENGQVERRAGISFQLIRPPNR